MISFGHKGKTNVKGWWLYVTLSIVICTGFCLGVGSLLDGLYLEMFFGSPADFPFNFQYSMWYVFFIGLGFLYHRYLNFKEFKELSVSCPLEGDDFTVYDSKDLANILKSTKPYEAYENGTAAKLIRQVIFKFQSSHSAEQASGMSSNLLDFYFHEQELKYNFIKYLAWLIPTLGFMGTVYGIALAIAQIGMASPDDPNLLRDVSGKLGVAFYTTLLALIQSSVLIYLTNIVEGQEEKSLNKLGQYVLNNLLNRLD